LPFAGIAGAIDDTLAGIPVRPVRHFSDLYAVDAEARALARELVQGTRVT
jgi:hypothetical protein